MKKIDHLKSNRLLRKISITAMVTFFIAGCASIPAPTEQLAVSKVAVDSASSAGVMNLHRCSLNLRWRKWMLPSRL